MNARQMFDSRRSRRHRRAVPLEQLTAGGSGRGKRLALREVANRGRRYADIGLFIREHVVEPGQEMTQLLETRPLEPSEGRGGAPEYLAGFDRGAHRTAEPESKGARSRLLGDVGRQPVEHRSWAFRLALVAGARPDAMTWMDHDVVSQLVLAGSLLAVWLSVDQAGRGRVCQVHSANGQPAASRGQVRA